MRRMVKRFGGVILAILLFGVSIIPVHASPEEQDAELILVTDEMAINIANTFAEAIAPDENLIAKNPLKLYDESGHAMTVEGYMTIKNNSTGVLQQVLIVSDGWGDGGRYLNLGYPYYLDTAGSTFHHNK